MVLSDRDILKLIYTEQPLISPFDKSNLNPSSVDLRLDPHIGIYNCNCIEIGAECTEITRVIIKNKGYLLKPKCFILASTLEVVNIPTHIQGFVETKGNIARAGLQVHNCDGHIDPGFQGKITLEIVNNNNIPIKLFPGILICQIFFFNMLSIPRNSYNGKYQRQNKPTSYKP